MHLKKTLFTFLSLCFILAFTASCENDRERDFTEPDLSFENILKSYASDRLIVNASKAADNASVEVTYGSLTRDNSFTQSANFKLINIVDGFPEVEFTAPLTKKDNSFYSFNYTGTVADGTKYYFSGSFVGADESDVTLVVDYNEFGLKDLAKTYEGNNLKINSAEAPEGVTASVDIDNSGKGTMTLNNIVVGELEVEVPVTFTVSDANDDTFTFTGEHDNSIRKIIVSGTYANNVLSINQTVEIEHEIVGKWNLKIDTDRNGKRNAVFIMSTKTVKPSLTNLFLSQAAKQLSPLLGDAVNSVTIEFNKNGKLNIQYVLPSGEETENSSTALPLDFDYFIEKQEDKEALYIAVPENLLNMLEVLIPQDFPVSIEQIKSVIELRGQYYIIPLQAEKDDRKGYTLFHLNEKFISKLLIEFSPIIENMIPDEGLTSVPVIGSISKKDILSHVDNLKTAVSIKVGLGFTKQEETTPSAK